MTMPLSEREVDPAAAEELARVAGPLLAAMAGLGTAVVVTDPRQSDNPIVFVNAAFTHLTGYRPDQALGRNCRFLQGEKTDRRATAALAAALRDGRRADAVLVNYHRDGAAFWNSLSIAPVLGQTGQTAFFLGTQNDVTAAFPTIDAAPAEPMQPNAGMVGGTMAWEWRIDERRIVGDAGFARAYGVSVSDAAAGITPAQFFAAIHPQDRNRIRLAVGGILQGAEIFSKEYRLVSHSGALRWVYAHGQCHWGAEEQPVYLSVVAVDITEQKRLQEQLRVAQTAGGVGTFEHVGGFGTAVVSAHFCSLLGLHPAADLPVRTINAMVSGDGPPIIDIAVQPAIGATSQAECRIACPGTGEIRWLMRRGEYLHDAETGGVRFSGVIYDITEAKRTEARLLSLTETLETRVEERTRERDRVWRVSQDLLGVANSAGRWISINPAWTDLLGWPEASILDQTSEWLEDSEDRGATATAFARIAAGERTVRFVNRMRRRQGGTRWLSWTAVEEDGKTYCVARDVTDEKRAAAALRQAEEQLRQSQKMEAVGQLTGGLAHDFNNLLAGISGNLEMLLIRLGEGRIPDLSRYVAAAQGSASRAAALTHRLLAFSRRQTLDPKPTGIGHLVAGMEDLIRRTVGPEVALHVATPGDLWTILVDAHQLENALLNLCINARDAMPAGGGLSIESRNMVLDERVATERQLRPGPYVCLTVSDTGTGMAPDVSARAFDPFFTTKALGQGTGLGLSMVYGFARQSGGDVSLESQPGTGTKVTLHLPRHDGDPDPIGPKKMSGLAERAESVQSVLLVDDDRTVRILIAEVLQNLGYSVIEAEEGAGAMTVLRSNVAIDLLVTDVGLPGGMNGRQLADAGRLARPGLKTLFITGYAENAALGIANLGAGTDVLTKPFAIETLANRVKSLIADSEGPPVPVVATGGQSLLEVEG